MKYGEDSSSLPSFDSDAWVEATGGPSHGRLYGFGVREKPQKILGISRSPSSCSSSYGDSSSSIITQEKLGEILEKMQQDMQERMEKKEKELQEKMEKREQEQMEKREQEFQEKMEKREEEFKAELRSQMQSLLAEIVNLQGK